MRARLRWWMSAAAVVSLQMYGGCAARRAPEPEAADLGDLESMVRSKVEQDLALFTAKRGRPPSSIEELYPDQTPPIQFWNLPFIVKLENGVVVVQPYGSR